MLNIDLKGRRALVAGVADDGGFGFAIAKSLAEAGATVVVGTWPPALNIFYNLLDRGKPLLETTRSGYLTAVSVSAYSLVAMVNRIAPLMRKGGSFLSLTYMAGERVIPGYGGGLSSAKAALESDTRVLAFEAGRKFGVRVNTISAGPWASRAASAIGIIEKMVEYCAANSPLTDPLRPEEVGSTAAFLSSDLATGITGATIYVDKGYHSMGMAVSGAPIP